MNLSEIYISFIEAGITPIKTLRQPEDKDDSDIIIGDDMSSILDCLDAFEIPAVFIFAGTLDSDKFLSEARVDSYGNEEYIDFSQIEPKLKSYKKYIGEHFVFELTAPIGNRMLRSLIYTEWFEGFMELLENAQQRVHENDELENQKTNMERQEQEEKQQQYIDKIIGRLRALNKDVDFSSFVLKSTTTKSAALAYVTKTIPELKQLDERHLKIELTSLIDEIKVQNIIEKK